MMGREGAYTSTIGPAERNASIVRYVEFDGEVFWDWAVSEYGDGLSWGRGKYRVLQYDNPSKHIQQRSNCNHPIQIINNHPRAQHRTTLREIQRS